jgi:hypothetical protein
MIDDQLVIRTERLRDSVEIFRDELRARYKAANRPVTGDEAREQAARLAERWLVEIANRDDVRRVLGDEIRNSSLSARSTRPRHEPS